MAAFDAVADRYADHYSRPGDRADNDVIFGRARARYRQTGGGLFIDLGCGPGVLLDWDEFMPVESYLGIDPSRRSIEIAREHHPDYRFLVGDHRRLPKDHSAAFVFGGFGPLPHVTNLTAFCTALRRALLGGGRFILMAEPSGRPVRIMEAEGVLCSRTPHDVAELQEAFDWATGLAITGHRRWVQRGPQWWQYLMLEAEQMLAPDPDRCEYIVVEGRA